jgi:hypothetical protein
MVLQDRAGFITLLEAAYGDPNRVATTKWIMRNNIQTNPDFSQYYLENHFITADQDWDPSAM